MVLKCSMILGCWQHLEKEGGVWQMIETDIIQDWSQTQALLDCWQYLLWDFTQSCLENCFLLFVMKLKLQHLCMCYGWDIFLSGKISQIFSSGPAFKCKQRGFWRYLLVEDKFRRVVPWAYRGKSTSELFYTDSLTAPSSFCAYLWIWISLITVLIVLLMLHFPL